MVDQQRHGTGYLIDHPLSIASRENPQRWPLSLLIEEGPIPPTPVEAIPPDYLDADIGPKALDQNGYGFCVPFQAETEKNAQEHKDWGVWLFETGTYSPPTGAFLARKWLKEGSPDGSFPGDGIPNEEGSYPEAVWKLAKVYGLPDRNNKPHKITAYYSISLKTLADIEIVQQAIMAYGPVNVAIPWPNNWSADPVAPDWLKPAPSSASSGHSFTICGWRTINGILWFICLNTWGFWGNAQGMFLIKASWLLTSPLGPQIIWKAVDFKDAPAPGGPDVVPAVDKTDRLLEVPVGTQFFTPDTNEPKVKLSGTDPLQKIRSPFAISSKQYAVLIQTGGVLQLLRVNKFKADGVTLAVKVLASSTLA